jgi:hypothetical protein
MHVSEKVPHVPKMLSDGDREKMLHQILCRHKMLVQAQNVGRHG